MRGRTVWTVPRVEVPTKHGLVVVGLRDERAVIITGPRGARLEPLHVKPEALVSPNDGLAYLRALAERYPDAVYRSRPSEEVERTRFTRRRGRLTVEMDALGGITISGTVSDRGRRWLSGAVASLGREEARLRRQD